MRINQTQHPLWRALARAVLGATMLSALLRGEPLPVPSVPQVTSTVAIPLATAEGALAAGLAGVAALQYEEVLRHSSLPPTLKREALLGLASAQLAEGRWSEARSTLESLPDSDPRIRLRLLLARIHSQNSPEGLKTALSSLDPASLPLADLPWWHLAKALLLEFENDLAGRDASFAEAQRLAGNEEQKTQFELLLYRSQLKRGPPLTNEKLHQLAEQTERERGRPIGFNLAKLYAIELARTGQTEEAVRLLEDRVSLASSNENGARGYLRLLLALVQGPEKSGGQKALDDILKDQKLPTAIQRIALDLLVGELGSDGRSEAAKKYLKSCLLEPWPSPGGRHPLTDEIHERLSFIYLQEGELKESGEQLSAWEKNVRERLGANFESNPQRRHLLRQSALIAWQSGQFQAAALVLGELHDLLESPSEKARFSLLQGDALFRSESFAAAAAAYENSWKEGRAADAAEILGPAYRQRIQSLLEASRVAEEAARIATEAGRLSEAAARSSEGSSNIAEAASWADSEAKHCPDLSARWQAEWNMAQRLRVTQQSLSALKRVTLLAAATPADSPPELKARLLWLKAELSLDTGTPAAVPALAAQLREVVSAMPAISKASRDDILSRVSLLEGRALLAQAVGNPSALASAQDTFSTLRADFPQSDPAASSLLIEARFLAAQNLPLKAEAAVTKLREDYPDSPYTPVALYEAAILRERRGHAGQVETGSGGGIYEPASQRLNRNQKIPEKASPPDPQHPRVLLKLLINNYPKHPLTFYALLKLANYARSEATFEDYNDADKLCDQILSDKNFASNQDIYRAEMTKADCQFALGGSDPLRYAEAFSRYERLHDNTALLSDVRIEAGCKMVETARAKGDRRESLRLAEMVLQSLEAQGLQKIDPARLGVTGPYWLSRTLFVQADQLEIEGKLSEAQRAYQRILTLQLPGAPLATASLLRLRKPEQATETPVPEPSGK